MAATELPVPNLGSPRIRAAMKVLGILPKDLEKKDPGKLDGSPGRFELIEKKRRHLIEQVQTLAAKGVEVHHHTPAGSPSASPAGHSTFIEEVLRKERASMEVMQRMAKKEVQNIVIQELDAKVIQQAGAQKQEESRQRLQQMIKERDEKLKQVRKVAEKKWEKSREVRERAMRQLEEEAKEITEKLNKANARAENRFEQIALEHQASREKNEENRSKKSVWQEQFQQQLLKGREQRYEEICAKHAAKLVKLEEALSQRQSNAEMILERQQQSMARVQKSQEEQQASAEQKYWETLTRHEKADKKREEDLVARIKEFVVRNRKAKDAHRQRYEKVIMEIEAEARAREHELQTPTRSPTLRPSSSEPTLSATAWHSRNLVALVKDNRERIRRAHRHAVEQQIAKIGDMRAKTEALMDARTQADKRRMAVLKNCGLEKAHLSEQVDRIRDSGPQKMLKLVEGQELEPEAAKRISELLERLGLKGLTPARDEDEAEKR